MLDFTWFSTQCIWFEILFVVTAFLLTVLVWAILRVKKALVSLGIITALRILYGILSYCNAAING